VTPAPHPNRRSVTDLYVSRRPSAGANSGDLAGARSAKVGIKAMADRVRRIGMHAIKEADGRLGTFCLYQAWIPNRYATTAGASAYKAT